MSSHKKILWNSNEFCRKNFDIHELLEFFLFLQLISGLNYSCSLWHISYHKVWLENSKKKVLCKEKNKTTAKTPCTDISKSCAATRWSKLVNVLHQRFTFTVLLAGILRKKSVFASASLSPRESDALKARNASTSWLMRRKSWDGIIQIWR